MNDILQQLLPLVKPAAVLIVLIIIGLFFAYRSDYKGHPERTLIAVQLTLSTIKHAITLGRAKKMAPPDRRHKADRRDEVRPDRRSSAENMGTISRPIPAIPDPRDEEKPS